MARLCRHSRKVLSEELMREASTRRPMCSHALSGDRVRSFSIYTSERGRPRARTCTEPGRQAAADVRRLSEKFTRIARLKHGRPWEGPAAHNMLREWTSIVGRAREVVGVEREPGNDAVADPHGAGGSGKTVSPSKSARTGRKCPRMGPVCGSGAPIGAGARAE